MKKINFIPFLFAALFLLLPPYLLARTPFGVMLLTLSALSACGMALLLTCFARKGLQPLWRYLPVVTGVAFNAICVHALTDVAAIWGAAAILATPIAAALLVMPLCYFVIYRFECRFHRFLISGKHCKI